jgi:hypothetical protein
MNCRRSIPKISYTNCIGSGFRIIASTHPLPIGMVSTNLTTNRLTHGNVNGTRL